MKLSFSGFWKVLQARPHSSSRRRKRAAARSPQSYQPRLESLEDRLLLSWLPLGPKPQFDPSNLLSSAGQPVSGRITSLAVTPDGAGNKIFLGAAGGGVWTAGDSPNAAPAWSARTDYVADLNALTANDAGAIDIGSIAVDPTNPAIIYAGTGEANGSLDSRYGTGILKSVDGGSTFDLIATGTADRPQAFFRRSIMRMIVDPRQGDTIYASLVKDGENWQDPGLVARNDIGIYRSRDGGTSWTKITRTDPLNPVQHHIGYGITVTDLEYTRDNAGGLTLFAAELSTGLWRSTDGGDTWQLLGNVGLPNPNQNENPDAPFQRIALAADHTPGAETLYSAYVDKYEQLIDVNVSKDNGNSWAAMQAPRGVSGVADPQNHSGAQGAYDLALGLSPDGSLYLAGQTRIVQYNGFYWRDITTDAAGLQPHSDFHAFAFSPQGQVYAGTDGGIWRYDPLFGGVGTWHDLNGPGLQTTQAYSAALSPRNPNTLLEANQDNGLARTTVGGTPWNTVMGGDAVFVRFATKAVDEDVEAVGDRAYVVRQGNPNSHLAVTLDSGVTWLNVSDPSDALPFTAHFAINPVDPAALLIGSNTRVWEQNRFNAYTWSPISPALDQNGVSDLAYAPTDEKTIYVGFSDGKLFRTDNDGQSWTADLGAWGNRKITRIVVDRHSPAIAYVTIGAFDVDLASDQVWRTTDSGASWTNISGNLPGIPAYALVLDYQNGPNLYVGNDDGVYHGTMDVNTSVWNWERFDNQLPYVQVRDLQLQSYNSGSTKYLVAATYGRGIWETKFDGHGKILPEGHAFNATEGVPYDGGVASFTPVDSSDLPSDYTATIDWGNGETTDGTIVAEADGSYSVTGDNTFVQLGDEAVTVDIHYAFDDSAASADSQAIVEDAPLAAVGTDVSTVEGGLFTGVVASFADEYPDATSDEFLAQINWGDGQVSEGQIIANGAGNFEIEGSIEYAQAGSYLVQVEILDAGGSNALADSAMFVTDATLTATGAGGLTTPVDTAFDGIVASFTDANVNASAGDFTANIGWGDGQTSAGVITPNASGGFDISGTNTYDPDGQYTITVTIMDQSGSTATATAGMDVTPPAPTVDDIQTESGSTEGDTTVLIDGTNFEDATGVFFGDEPAQEFTILSDNQISAVAPPDDGGPVDITVTNPGGTSAPSPNDMFTYEYPTTTTLSTSGGSASFGQALTLTASVRAAAPGAGTPTGMVTFKDNGAIVGTGTLNASGQATLTISSLGVGSHTLTAVYGGASDFMSSASSPLTQVVGADGTTVGISSSADPSVYRQSVTFTATVSAAAPGSGTPTGTIVFKDGSTVLGTATITASGQATLSLSSLAVGSHTITAVYAGDGNFTGAVSVGLAQVVNKDATTTTLTSSADPSNVGQSVTFTASVAVTAPGSATPTGTITFQDGATILGRATISAGSQATFTTSTLIAGNHTISASYSGDANCSSSGALLTQTVNSSGGSGGGPHPVAG